jgi:hypothetical protein
MTHDRDCLPGDGELIFTFENLESLILAMMNVWRRPAAPRPKRKEMANTKYAGRSSSKLPLDPTLTAARPQPRHARE